MTGRTTASRTTRADRRLLWLVLVLLVGLLGMHGLASDHAGSALTADPVAASSADVLHGGTTCMTMAVPVPAVPVAGPRVASPPGHGGMAMAGLCLAALTGTLLLAAARRPLPVRSRPDDRVLSRLLARTPALPAPRPPDLVAGLCVSRT